MNDPKALKERMLRYLLPVCLATLVININKFFEQTWNDPMKTNSKNKIVDFYNQKDYLSDLLFTWIIKYILPFTGICQMAKVMVENEANLTSSYPKLAFELAHSKVEKCRYVSYMW